MRRIIVSEFVTVDGVVEDPGGGAGWELGGWSFKFDDSDGKRDISARDAYRRALALLHDDAARRLLEARLSDLPDARPAGAAS